MNFRSNLMNYIKARYPLILVQSIEEDRLSLDMEGIAKELGNEIITWSISSGLKRKGVAIDPSTADLKRAVEACENIAKEGGNALFVFFDVTVLLNGASGSPIQRRALKEFALRIKTEGYRCNCILVSDCAELPSDLMSEVSVLDYPLPNKEEVRAQIKDFVARFKDEPKVKVDASQETIDALTDASLGLTYAEIENCLSKALVEDKCLDASDVRTILKEKKQIVKKNEILEYVDNSLSLEDVGGLNVLKKWLKIREFSFSDDAKDFGLNPPKGVLLVGVPGCGKSLTAKCIATAWKMPLLKLDMGKVFGKYVGDSESNIRSALKTAEAIAPCILWIDEIEKGLGGDNDGGTSSRVFGSILTWMQDKSAPVFTFATANNIQKLPAELLRKGRFDEIFFVDLPDFEERKKILEIHILKTGRKVENFDVDALAKMSGEDTLGKNIRFSGAEIESWVKDSLMEAYSKRVLNKNQEADLSMDDFETVLKRMVPMAKMRLEDFKQLREWANENAVSASASMEDKVAKSASLGGRVIEL